MEQAKAKAKLIDLMKDLHVGFLTTMRDGRHYSRPMGMQQSEFDGDLWFFAYDDSQKVADITAEPQVNVSLGDSNTWVSLSGFAEVVRDRAKAEELWSTPLKAWFPEGVDEPGIVLIRVEVESAEYWDTTSSLATQAIGLVKSTVTGRPSGGGENEKIEL